jgi:hypothetical protein
LRFVNNSHPATAELAGDAVMRDGLADHDKYLREFILGGIADAVKRKNTVVRDQCPVVSRTHANFTGH